MRLLSIHPKTFARIVGSSLFTTVNVALIILCFLDVAFESMVMTDTSECFSLFSINIAHPLLSDSGANGGSKFCKKPTTKYDKDSYDKQNSYNLPLFRDLLELPHASNRFQRMPYVLHQLFA